jgi:hypothetical protein
MRNVILQEFVSLDGLAAGPNDAKIVKTSAAKEVAKLKQESDKVDPFAMTLPKTTSFDRGAVLLAYTAARARSVAR